MVCMELLSIQPSRIKIEGKNTFFVVSRNACITQDSQILSWCVLKETFFKKKFHLPKTLLQSITRVLFLGKVSGWRADYRGLVFYSTICSHFCQQTAKNRLLSHQSTRRKLALIHFALLFSCSAQWTQTKKKQRAGWTIKAHNVEATQMQSHHCDYPVPQANNTSQ